MVEQNDFWVFGYGSLMWRPGFPFEDRLPALLRGYHRAFCILSHRYRGTEEKPGLVLGLDRGGSCKGFVYRVAPAHRQETIAYLQDRELVNGVYHERMVSVEVCDGRRLKAYGFVADRSNAQYCGGIDEEETLRLLRQGRGEAGTSVAYLQDTVRHLDDLGICDGHLHRLLDRIEA